LSANTESVGCSCSELTRVLSRASAARCDPELSEQNTRQARACRPSVRSAGENGDCGGAGSPVDLGIADSRVTLDLAVAGLATELEH